MRDSELLIADANPALRTGTEFISPVVSGATSSDSPTPNSSTPGSGPISASSGGVSELGFERLAVQPMDVAGTVSHHSSPTAITSGPATRNGRTPYLPDSVPTRVDRNVSRMPVGIPISAAPSGLYPSVPCRNSAW